MDKGRDDLVFEAVLTTALKENIKLEMDTIPSEKELMNTLSFSLKFVKNMKKLIRTMVHKHLLNNLILAARYAASVFFVSISILFSLLLLSEPVRADVQSVVVEWFDKYVNFSTVPTDESAEKNWTLGYLPNGLREMERINLNEITMIIWMNDLGESIHLEYVSKQFGYDFAVDSEYTFHSEISIGDLEGHLFSSTEPGGQSTILWSNESTNFMLSSNLNAEKLTKVAKNVESLDK